MSVKGNGLQQNWFIKRLFSNCWFYISIIFFKAENTHPTIINIILFSLVCQWVLDVFTF
jgi:hypothetical protein